MSVRFLGFLGRRIGSSPILGVVTVRDEDLATAPFLRRTLEDLERGDQLDLIRLTPLSRTETAELARSVAPRMIADRHGLEDWIWRVSEGNPFMVVEAMRGASEGRVADAGGIVPSDRVRDLIGRRLDRLGVPGRQLAAAAAVMGGPALTAARHLPESPLQRARTCDLHFARAHSLGWSGATGDALDGHGRSLALAEMLGDDARLQRALTGMCSALASAGRHVEALAMAERALTGATAAEDWAGQFWVPYQPGANLFGPRRLPASREARPAGRGLSRPGSRPLGRGDPRPASAGRVSLLACPEPGHAGRLLRGELRRPHPVGVAARVDAHPPVPRRVHRCATPPSWRPHMVAFIKSSMSWAPP
jgi:hypothetical protein